MRAFPRGRGVCGLLCYWWALDKADEVIGQEVLRLHGHVRIPFNRYFPPVTVDGCGDATRWIVMGNVMVIVML